MTTNAMKKAAEYAGDLYRSNGITMNIQARYKGILVRGKFNAEPQDAPTRLIPWSELESDDDSVLNAVKELEAELNNGGNR